MKIQCSCGAKYNFDVTPEMVRSPIKFICQSCGQDSSDFVNELIRREFAGQVPAVAKPPASLQPTASAVPAAPTPPAVSRLKISREQPQAAAPAAAQAEEAPVAAKYCSKHRGEPATEHCIVCKKPICPKCMEMFGYFCSPLCKGNAEAHNIVAPVYAGQKFEVERQFWRKIGLIFGSIGAAVILALGFWIWYAWFSSVPHTYFSVRFDDTDRAYAGASQLVGKDQIVFLHGGTLARYDLKTKKSIWSQELIAQDQIAEIVKAENEQRARENESDEFSRIPPPGSQERAAKITLQRVLSLHVVGQNIWVGAPGKLTHYNWADGKILQKITLPESGGELAWRNDELQIPGTQSVTHINLTDGAARVENFSEPGAATIASTQNAGAEFFAGNSEPLDPNRVAAQAQNLKLPARIALPALLANESHEQQLEAALKEGDPQRPKSNGQQKKRIAGRSTLIPSENGYIQFAVHLVEEKYISHVAMKTPPKKSVLNDANLNASQTTEVANEMLNDRQRANGGDTVTEDVSRYQVSIRRTDSPDVVDWTGEVIGPPNIFPLKTVTVLTAGKTVIVFDKTNKKLWETTLTYSVLGGDAEFYQEVSQFGEGPCAEHGDTLYVFDQAVLSAFDLSTGNARWRLPSVGVVGLFFDDQGMVYVNTTSGSPDDIKYSRQIDITKSTDDILLKVDPKTGKTLWSIKPGGFISYLSGKFTYTVESYDPNPTDEIELSDTLSGLQKPPHLRITRVSPKDGHILWDYEQPRCPIDVRFNENSIELVFKKEVQVLRYLTF